MCFGATTPSPPPAPPPPPQLAQTPAPATVRGNLSNTFAANGNTILTSAQGDSSDLNANLGKKTLLGQ